MKTSELIDRLAKDLRPLPTLDYLISYALMAGILLAGIAFFCLLGVRHDIDNALANVRFLFKFVVTLSLAAPAAALYFQMGKPGLVLHPARALLLSPALLILASLFELSVSQPGTWLALAIGRNALNCLTFIPLISVGPLVCLLYAMRRGAPTRPGLAGTIAGLAAAGISATFYAANCSDDSPLFVLMWYPLAVGTVALAGYLLGNKLLRW